MPLVALNTTSLMYTNPALLLDAGGPRPPPSLPLSLLSPSFISQGLLMKTNYQTSYSQMDMGTSSYFSFNMAALASMSNQQLEVSNELHMPLSCLPLLPPTAWRPTFLRPHC